MTYRVAKCIKKNHSENGYVSHNISSSGMADATLFYCYLCRDVCVKHSNLHCGFCLSTLSASNVIPSMSTLLATTKICSCNNKHLYMTFDNNTFSNYLQGGMYTSVCILNHVLVPNIYKLYRAGYVLWYTYTV